MRRDNLEETLKEALQHEVSVEAFHLEGLEGRIATELEGRLPNRSFLEALKQLVAPTRGTRLGQLAVIGATAVIFIVLGAFLAGRLPFLGGSPKDTIRFSAAAESEGAVLFLMPAPGAQSVTVVGNFNGWDATPLSDKDGDGIWTASISLPPGRYEYAFVVDGRWWGQDPLADEYVRSFGEYNSVRYVGRAGDGA
jgi:hypothetical protein